MDKFFLNKRDYMKKALLVLSALLSVSAFAQNRPALAGKYVKVWGSNECPDEMGIIANTYIVEGDHADTLDFYQKKNGKIRKYDYAFYNKDYIQKDVYVLPMWKGRTVEVVTVKESIFGDKVLRREITTTAPAGDRTFDMYYEVSAGNNVMACRFKRIGY